MKKRFLPHKEFNYIYSKVPRLCVDLIIVKGKKILLTKRSIPPFKGLWHLPGGGVLFREKVEDALKRVAKEELDINVKMQKFLGYFELLKEGPHRHSIALQFRCKIKGKNEPRELEQASKYNFFGKLPKNTIPIQKEFLKNNWKKIFE